jgi:hypothetical protein
LAQQYLHAEFEEEYEWDYQDSIPNAYVDVVEMNDFDRIECYHDDLPFLQARKKLLYFMQAISYYCYEIVKSPQFDTLALFVIVGNSIVLVLDNPKDKNPSSILDELDLYFIIFYTAEMGVKIIAYGFIMSKNAYIKDYWNMLDFVIVFTS